MSSQDDAIQKSKGPCIILAGAGTGKTYTIAEKAKYLIEKNIYSPEKIVCLTFSNEAVKSLQNRISAIIKNQNQPIIRTFHSFCAELIRTHGNLININQNFRIILPDEAKILLHKNFKLHPRLCIRYIDVIGIAKDLGLKISDYEEYMQKKQYELKIGIEALEGLIRELQFRLQTIHLNPNRNYKERASLKDRLEHLTSLLQIKKFVSAWKAYEKIKEKRSILDYADLHIQALTLLKENPEIAREYEYIIVDEFQDTNKLQCQLLVLLAPHKNITVVGDINQSIYRFRGAYKDNLTSFKQAFEVNSEDVFALDASRRSPNTILRTANTLIKKNYRNKEECIQVLNHENREGDSIQVIELADEKEEARKIVEIIEKNQSAQIPLEEICVMFRTHQQSRRLKRELDEKNIPYASVNHISLTSIPHIKKTLNYLVIMNKAEKKSGGGEHAWWELLYQENFLKEDFFSISRAIKKNLDSPCLSQELILQMPKLELTEEGKKKIEAILKSINKISSYEKKPVNELIRKVAYMIAPEEELKNNVILNIDHLCRIAKDFTESESPEMDNFLYH